jgi:hypothetical protein
MTCKVKNQPPGVPSIPSGPTSGRKGDALRFSTAAEDPDGDSVSIRFDWGDSTTTDWSAPVWSGDSIVMMHAWRGFGAYSIRARARDAQGLASVWSGEHQLTVSSFAATFGGDVGDFGYSVQHTPDAGFIVAGSTYSYGAGWCDIWLIKTDAEGNKVWDKTFGGANNDYGNSVQQTFDGGYIVAGCTYSHGSGGGDVWLIKTDALGNGVWAKTFGGPSLDAGNCVEQISDGGYIIAGSTSSYGAGLPDIWLIKTDAYGNEVWDRTFGGTESDEGTSVQQTLDGGYIVSGYTASQGEGGYDVWLVKTDSAGNKLWDRTFGGGGDDRAYSVRQTADRGYVICGYTASSGAGEDDVWLTKTDSSGERLWDRTFGGTEWERGYSAEQTFDGGYVITGYTYTYGVTGPDVWLIKTDESGTGVWDKAFGATSRDEGYSVRQTSDGGYVVVGYTIPSFSEDADVLLIKTDAEGN